MQLFSLSLLGHIKILGALMWPLGCTLPISDIRGLQGLDMDYYQC